jgi:hypothetical protein
MPRRVIVPQRVVLCIRGPVQILRVRGQGSGIRGRGSGSVQHSSFVGRRSSLVAHRDGAPGREGLAGGGRAGRHADAAEVVAVPGIRRKDDAARRDTYTYGGRMEPPRAEA